MKNHEVPQDNEGLQEGKQLDLCYVVDENGNYVTVPSCGWAPKNAALFQAWKVIHEKVEEVRQQVLQGKRSPIAYFMVINIMDVKLLASYVGLPKWKVRRHLQPSGFSKLDEAVLQRYAEVFRIPDEALTNFRVSVENK
jgi:hypothetical protein